MPESLPRTDVAHDGSDSPSRTLDVAQTSDGAFLNSGAASSSPGQGSRFTVLRLHAQGGLGLVHIAHDEQLKRDVALKEIRPERADHEEARRRFLAEAEITGQLEHPGVVPIYAIEADASGRPAYAMRFIQGRTLGDSIKAYHDKPTPIALRDLLQKFVSVCQTLAYAHSKGVIHRDLKPANIMLGDYGETLVVDWGLAKRIGGPQATSAHASDGPPHAALDSSDTAVTVDYAPKHPRSASDRAAMTVAGQIVGTLAYMAPEQARGDVESVGPAADVYGLGAILYELLTGQAPYQGKTIPEVLAKVQAGSPEPPISRTARVPKALNAVCLKAMARATGDRYGTAAELARDVERWLADESVTAYPEPWPTRVGRWARRHRTLVAASAALLLAATIAVTVGIILLGAAKRKTDDARDELADALKQVEKKAAGERSARSKAVDALGFMTTELQVKLRDFPEMQKLRQDLLAKALADLEAIVKEIDDRSLDQANSATADLSINAAYIYMGDISRQLGKAKLAHEYFLHSRDLLEKNVKIVPNSPKLNRNLALTLNRLGDWEYYTKNNTVEAAKLYAETLPLLKLAEEEARHPERFPPEHQLEVKTVKRTLLGTHSRFATLHKEHFRLQEAINSYLTCLDIITEIEQLERSEGFRLPDDDLNDRYRVYTLLGETHWQMGDMTGAKPYFEKGMKGYKEMSDASPHNVLLKDTLASGHSRYGEFLLRIKDLKGARETCEIAVQLSDEVARSDPNNNEVQRLLAMSLYRLGVVEDRAGDPTASAKHLGRCLEIREKLAKAEPDHESRKVDLMISLARCGQIDRAVKTAVELRRGAEKKIYVLVQIACTYAICVEMMEKNRGTKPATVEYTKLKDQYSAASVEALETAVANGLKDLTSLADEEDLAGVFEYPPFRSLMVRASSKKAP